MGFSPQNPSREHLYSQELQLKLYQAFIFSIPILFSIILFLLFYLFYLKKRVSSISSSSANNTQNSNPRATTVSSTVNMDVEYIFRKLPVIQYDGSLETRETLCSICLGEYELKEELNQIPTCKHVFHIDCISHWILSNGTCPLCRCAVFVSRPSKGPINPEERITYEVAAEQPDHVTITVSSAAEVCEGSSGSSGESISQDNADESSVVIHIQSPNE